MGWNHIKAPLNARLNDPVTLQIYFIMYKTTPCTHTHPSFARGWSTQFFTNQTPQMVNLVVEPMNNECMQTNNKPKSMCAAVYYMCVSILFHNRPSLYSTIRCGSPIISLWAGSARWQDTNTACWLDLTVRRWSEWFCDKGTRSLTTEDVLEADGVIAASQCIQSQVWTR